MQYNIFTNRLPTVSEWQSLRKNAGWHFYNDIDSQTALDNSLFGVCVYDNDNMLIGMARVVGDGKSCFYIQDVVVHSDWRSQGIGKIVMTEVLKYIDANAAERAVVALMSAKGREKFYESFGFIKRPTDNLGHGMVRFL